ncbi:MAG: hypothetical protein NT016_03015 [Candidatus Aenigmarchaeota archaeon]|nr:hypothetical protein [Candidatus Aenigmarchaeota archaeon]
MENGSKFAFAVMIMASLALSVPAALATAVYTEYDGSGDFKMASSITSGVMPTIYDTVESHTACTGACCEQCCGNSCYGSEEGRYSGVSFLTNEEGSLAVDYGEVTNGCINLNQQTVEQKSDEGRTITTEYNTGVNGTGYAYTWTTGVPLHSYGYQYANGSGMTWAFFGQLNQFDGNFGFEALYGAGTHDCNYGYIIMENEYQILNSPIIYRPIAMRMVCLDPGYSYAALYGNGTSLLNADVSVNAGHTDWMVSTNLEGQAALNINADSNDGLDFNFNMTLG